MCTVNGVDVGCFQEFDQDLSWVETDNAINHTWATLVLGNGRIFEALYYAGDYVCGTADGYHMTQWGSKCWADNGRTWQWIVGNYYYNVGLSIDNDYNLLVNRSFESGVAEWGLQNPGSNWALYTWPPAYHRSWFVEYNPGGNPWTSVYQDVRYNVNPGDRYRASAAIRCPSYNPGGGCWITVAIWGIGAGGPWESSSTRYFVPNDGAWRVYTDDMYTKTGFAYQHNVLRFEVYNEQQKNVDIDYATLWF